MKKIYFSIVLLLLSSFMLAQPANDNCAGATALGNLPTPGACIAGVQNGTAVTVNGQSTVGATANNPYTYIGSCEGGATDMFSPALDTWYSFVATGTTVNISVGNFPGVNIGLWSGTCGNLAGRGCSIDGNLTVTQIQAGQTYFIQISGNTTTLTDAAFNISVDNDIDCNNCLQTSSYTATPPPVNGAYAPGSTVTFCYHIGSYLQQNTNWLHGVQVNLGSGWNAATVVPGNPVPVSTNGDFYWYPAGIGVVNGQNWGMGFYWDNNPADGNPRNNYGDNATAATAAQWNFCVTVTSNTSCVSGADLNVTFNTSGDGESGSWTSAGCSGDNPTVINAVGSCCPPTVTPTNVTCNGANNGSITGTPPGGTGPYDYVWTGPAGYSVTNNNVAGANTITGLAPGTYTLNMTDNNNCLQTLTVTITQPAAINATITPTNPTCAGTGSINVTGITGGATPYDISINNGSTYIFNNVTTGNATGLAAGSYTVFIRDNNNCTQAFPVTTLTAAGTVNSSFVAPAAQCLTGNNYSFTPTSTGNIVAGTTTYTWNFGDAGTAGPSTSTAAVTHTYATAGTFTVSLTTATGACTNTFTTTITVNPMPALPTATLTQPTCGLNNGVINITGPGTTYSLNAAGGPFTATTNYPNLAPGTYTVYVRNGTTCTSSQTFVLVNVPGPTSVALTSVAAACGASNGSVGIGNVTGGTAGYTYSFNVPGGPFAALTPTVTVNSLAAATYTVYIRDANGCTTSSTVVVANLSGPSGPNASSTNANCGASNGTVTLAPPTTGTGPFTYSFNGSGFTTTTNYTGLAANTYTYVVRDNFGCPVNGSITVNNTPGPSAVALTQTPASCGATNGVINVGTVTGGVAAFQYSINGTTFQAGTSFTGLASGPYTVTVRDVNNCTVTNTITVTNAAAPTLALTTQTNVSCFGGNTGSATFTASGGGGGYTYTLNTGASNVTGVFINLPFGNYTATVTDVFGCTATQTVSITQPTALSGSITAQTNVLCNAGNTGAVTIAGSGGTVTYQYSLNGGAFQASGTFSPLVAGSYVVTVRDNRGCTFPVPVTITQPTPLTVGVTSINANCTAANGTATATPAGGTPGPGPGYTYTWTPSGGNNATTVGLVSGNYVVTVRDGNNCQVTGNVTIGNTPGGTAAAAVVSQISCNGGNNGSISVSMTATSATSYTYAWLPSGGSGSTATGLTAGVYTVNVTDNFGCTSTANAAVTEPLALTLNLASTNVSCNGGTDGTINATVNGGTLAYTYVWVPNVGSTANVTSLPVGSYSLTVTDAHSCTVTATRNITQPTALSITPVVNSSHCNQSDGSITVTGAGGFPGYSFSINGGPFITPGVFNTLAAATYNITIKDVNGCTATFPVTVTDLAGPAASITASSNVLCNGQCNGSATVGITGGIPPYSYIWQNGSVTPSATNLCAGVYTVTATDASGCNASAGVTITQPTLLVANASGVDPLCNGGNNGTGSAGALGGTPSAGGTYNYSWTTIPAQNTANASGLIAGPYNVTVTDANGCTAVASITLNNPPALTASITTVNLDCFGQCIGSATATIGNAALPILYAWTGGQTTQTASGLCAGSYTVNVTDAHGCTATSNTIITQPTQLTATITGTGNETCFNTTDGFVQSSAGGGTPGYTYTWSNGMSGSTIDSLDAGDYTLTVTDTKGCIVTALGTVTAPPALTLSLTKTDVSCNYGPSNPVCDGGANAVFGGGTTPYAGFLWQPSLYGGPNPSTLCAGTHTVTLTDGNGCTITDSVTINEPPLFSAVVTADSSHCGFNDGAANVSVSGGTTPHVITWSNGPVTPYNGAIPHGIYNVTIDDANGCQVIGTAIVNDIDGPIVTVTDSTMVTCFGLSNGTALATVSGGTTPYASIGWMPTSQSGLSASNLPPGTATISVYDAVGCFAGDQVLITQPADIVSAVTAHTDVTCYNLFNGTATIQATGGVGPYSFDFYAPLQTQPGTPNTPVTFVGLGVGPVGSSITYTVMVTDNNNCKDSTFVTITQPQVLLISNPVANDITCAGLNDGDISVTANGGTPAFNYAWTSSNAGFVSPVSPGTPSITNLGAGTYTLVLTDQNSCTTNGQYTINEPPPIQLDSIVSTASCGAANGTATVTVVGGTPGPGGYGFHWNNVPNALTATATALGPNIYHCDVTDANSCTVGIDVVIPNASGPVEDTIVATSTTCYSYSDGAVDVDVTGGTMPLTYTWTNAAGTQLLTGPIDFITGIPAGVYSVHVEDNFHCFFNSTIVVDQPAQVILLASQDGEFCYGDSIQVSANVNGGTSPYTWNWSENGTAQPSLNTSTGLFSGPHWVHPSYSPPLHTYSVTVTDANGCPPAANQTIAITALPPIVLPTQSYSVCNTNQITMTANATGGDGTPISYSWAPGGLTGPSITVTGQDDVDHIQEFTVTATDGCSEPTITTFSINISPTPTAVLLANTTSGCADLTVNFSGTGGSGPDFANCTYSWTFGDGQSGSGMSPTNIYSSTGLQVDSFDVQLTVTTPAGCSDVATANNYIVVYPKPIPEFTYNPLSTTEFDPQVNFYNQSLYGATYEWNFGELISTTNSSTDENPLHIYSGPGYYNVLLEVTSPNGCYDTVSHVIYIEPEFAIYIPNAFSPNEDSKNEIFLPLGIGIDEERFHMYIFDRWGEIIFETNNYAKGWDGTAKGKSAFVQEDVYIYKVVVYDVKNNKHNLTGHVTVVR